jgi:hypothetical protein
MPASNMGLEIIACHPKSEASTVSFPGTGTMRIGLSAQAHPLPHVGEWALPQLSWND